MEMVRDQAEKATTGWPGFGFHPTSKHSAQKVVENLNSKWFYREVNKITITNLKTQCPESGGKFKLQMVLQRGK